MSAFRRSLSGGALRRTALRGMVLVVLGAPAPAGAQLCQGVPLGSGAAAVTAFLGVADAASSGAGGAVSYQLGAPLALSAGYHRTRYDGSDAAVSSLRGGVSVQGASFDDVGAVHVAICAAAGAARDRVGDLTILSVPVGVAAGLALPLAPRTHAVLHVEPRVVFTRREVAGFSRSTRFMGVRGGATLAWRGLFAGVAHERERARSADSSTILLVGVRIGGPNIAPTMDTGSGP